MSFIAESFKLKDLESVHSDSLYDELWNSWKDRLGAARKCVSVWVTNTLSLLMSSAKKKIKTYIRIQIRVLFYLTSKIWPQWNATSMNSKQRAKIHPTAVTVSLVGVCWPIYQDQSLLKKHTHWRDVQKEKTNFSGYQRNRTNIFDHSARLLTDLHSLLEAQLSTFHGHFMAPWSQNINTSKTIRSKSLMRELRAGSQMDTNKK